MKYNLQTKELEGTPKEIKEYLEPFIKGTQTTEAEAHRQEEELLKKQEELQQAIKKETFFRTRAGRWNEVEDKIITEAYSRATGRGIQQLDELTKKFPHRTRTAILQRACKLKVTKQYMLRTRPKRPRTLDERRISLARASQPKKFPRLIGSYKEDTLIAMLKDVIFNKRRMTYRTEALHLGITKEGDWEVLLLSIARHVTTISHYFGVPNNFKFVGKGLYELTYGEY